MSTRPAEMIKFWPIQTSRIGLGSYTVATTMISRNTHGQHNQHHGYSCAAQASLPVRVGQFFERPSPSRHQCLLHSGRDPMTPRPHGRATWRGPHGPGQLRPNFRCLFIRKERCGRHMPSFIPTRRLLYVSRINYTSYILA